MSSRINAPKVGGRSNRVVITGLGAITPLAVGAQPSFERMIRGDNGIGTITRIDVEANATKIAGEVRGTVLQIEAHFDRMQLKRLDPFSQLGVIAAREAAADAGLDMASAHFDASRCGVILGTGIGGIEGILAQHTVITASGPRRVTPFFVPNIMSNALAGNVAIEFGLEGPCYATSSACASSGHALGLAMREIRNGYADVMLAGGAETATNPLCLAGFNQIKALSTRNDAPELASRPFDRDRDGFVIGEGAGILVLESETHALARGARIYCELAGFGQSDDAGHITAPDATAVKPARALSHAIRDAGLNVDEVDYVNAHGTSTMLNDAMETLAIKVAMGEEAAARTAISSTKSMIGHLIGAASAVEAVVTALTLQRGVAHPTRNLDNPDVENGCDLDYIPGSAREKPFRAALSNSFGFGGHNVSLAFRRWD